jgi:hypothetical protein
VDPSQLEPRRHEPPLGWTVEAFEAVTRALAEALLAAVKDVAASDANAPQRPRKGPRQARYRPNVKPSPTKDRALPRLEPRA